ncbi:MAG: cupin domain-containing protein [Candidatus Omnitrophota bacterium]
MIKKSTKQDVEVRKNMREGTGEVVIKHHLRKDEINASCRLCAQLTVSPGSSIGLHEHAGEDEIFIIQEGRGVVEDNNREVEVCAGDAILTGQGAKHAIKNIGDSNLVITAIILPYNKS